MTFDTANDFLLSLPRFTDQGAAAYRPGLERMHALMEGMGHPHETFQSVHIAGTNGKGSTASMLAAISTATGRKTGLHTSPHLFQVTERMRLDGVPASTEWFAGAVERFENLFREVGPSFFEATVALSFLYFADMNVDLAIVEVGMGGRLDATNVLQPELALITNIGLDHVAFLGNTLPEVAREKAGIVKENVPLLTAANQPEVLDTIRRITNRCHAPFHSVPEEVEVRRLAASADGVELDVRTPLRTYEGLSVGLPGMHQHRNALLALRAAELLFDEVSHKAEAVYRGLQEVRALSGLRGRLEVLQTDPLVIADVAHNADGLAAALDFVLSLHKGRLYVLFGAMRDKDVTQMAGRLEEAGATVWPVEIGTERAVPASELADLLEAHGLTVMPPCEVAEGILRFRQQAEADDALLITGSHQVVAQLAGIF